MLRKLSSSYAKSKYKSHLSRNPAQNRKLETLGMELACMVTSCIRQNASLGALRFGHSHTVILSENNICWLMFPDRSKEMSLFTRIFFLSDTCSILTSLTQTDTSLFGLVLMVPRTQPTVALNRRKCPHSVHSKPLLQTQQSHSFIAPSTPKLDTHTQIYLVLFKCIG